MNRNGTLVIVTLVLMLTWGAGQARALSVGFSISDGDVTVGEPFSVTVTVSDAFSEVNPPDEIIAFGFDVFLSDPSLVGFTSATVASPFNDDSESFPSTDVAGSVFPGVTDDGLTLATLNFMALGPGHLTLGIVSDLTDPNEGLIYFLAGAQDLTSGFCLTVSPVPEPSSMWLLGAGLIGLMGRVGFRRRRTSNRLFE